MSIFDVGDIGGFNQMKALQQLLYQKNDSSDDSPDEDIEAMKQRKMGPSDLGSKLKQNDSKTNKKETVEEKNKELPPELEAEEKDELEKWLDNQQKEDDDILETRKRPEYTIMYKQAIGTEDVFLGINNRTSSSMSCEDMVIEISMPEETVSVEEMQLDVTEKQIDLKTSIYRLKLPLVHPINPDKGSARFDSDKNCLILTLRMNREYDFTNF